MSLSVARGVYNPEKERFHFYVAFKPGLDPTAKERGVEASFPIEVAVSLTETGELADLAFELPPPCEAKEVLLYISRTPSASIVRRHHLRRRPGVRPQRRRRDRDHRQPGTRRRGKDHRGGNRLGLP